MNTQRIYEDFMKKSVKIPGALKALFKENNIKTKKDLDEWCGSEGRKKLYKKVEKMAPTHWIGIKTPESSVRSNYEKLLLGYKGYDKNGNKKIIEEYKSDKIITGDDWYNSSCYVY